MQKVFSVPYFSIRGVNFSNNISITQVRINERNTDLTRGVNFSNNISITQVRINERNTDLTRPLQPPNHELPPLHGLIISPHVNYSAVKLPKNIWNLMQSFFLEKVPSNFWGKETLCFIFISFPIS